MISRTPSNRTAFAFSALFLASAIAAQAQTLAYGPADPTVNEADIAQLGYGSSSGARYLNAGGGPYVGQTFTTGVGLGAGFTLSGFTFDTYDGGTSFEPVGIVIGSISGATFTPLHSVSAFPNARSSTNHFLTYTLTAPLSLSASTLYGAAMRIDGEFGATYVGLAQINENLYADGSLFTLSGTTVSLEASRDPVFHLDLSATPIPEPSALAALAGGAALGLVATRRRRAS